MNRKEILPNWLKCTEEDYEKSRDYFQQAIELDPAYALAYIGLGDYYFACAYEGYLAPRAAWPKAKAAFEKALDIDDTLALAHRGLAKYSEIYLWNWPEAQLRYNRALELDPDNPLVHFSYSWFLLTMNKEDQAIEEMKIASNLDPLTRVYSLQIGQFLLYGGVIKMRSSN